MKAKGIPHLLVTSLAIAGLTACGPEMGDGSSTPRAGQSADSSRPGADPADSKSAPAGNTTMAPSSDAVASKDVSKVPTRVADDATIISAVKAEIDKDPELAPLNIDVQSKDGLVTLKGIAPNEATADRAAQIAVSVAGVKQVTNQVAPRRG